MIGFEWQAVDECRERLDKNVKIVKGRGKIFFNVYWNQFEQVHLHFSLFSFYRNIVIIYNIISGK